MSVQWPFQFLGFQPEPGRASKDVYFFHAHNRVIKIKASVMNVPGNEACLVDLAPLRFWTVLFPGKQGKIDWRSAKAWIIGKQRAAGWYQDGSAPIVHKDLNARNAPKP